MTVPLSEKIEKMVMDISREMESQSLTGFELTFRSGWRFKLNHPKASKLIGSDNFTYPRDKGFKVEEKE